MLDEKFDSKFYIQFGNLKSDIKDNYYLGVQERMVENSIVECMLIAEKENKKYAIAVEDVCGVQYTRYIDLDCFESYHYVNIDEGR